MCSNRLTVPTEIVESAVLNMIQARLGARMAEVRVFITEEIKAILSSMPNCRRELQAQVAEAERRISNLVEAITSAPSPALTKKLSELEKHREGLETELASLAMTAPLMPTPQLIEQRIREALKFEDARAGHERIRTMLLDGKIECTPQDDRSYRLRWSIVPDVVLKTETPASSSSKRASIHFGCGGWI